jgi:pseudouridine-5'-phosphate glycosidase
MLADIKQHFLFSDEAATARKLHLPIVALESAVITHGLPQPENIQLAKDVESEVRANRAVPATIALVNGKVRVGLSGAEIEQLGALPDTRKISRRDFGVAIARRLSGGTTVAGTLIAAHAAGIKVFATGGIGGVHRQAANDISADLPELSRTPLVVVCAGAKSILDLPATLELLETLGVPVIGYQTDEFPAFFSRSSGQKLTIRADAPEEVAEIARAHWGMGLESALLVTVPPPEESALPGDEVEAAIAQALEDARRDQIHGADVTPYLLSRVSKLSGGSTLKTNLALLRNNARVAAQIAVALTPRRTM